MGVTTYVQNWRDLLFAPHLDFELNSLAMRTFLYVVLGTEKDLLELRDCRTNVTILAGPLVDLGLTEPVVRVPAEARERVVIEGRGLLPAMLAGLLKKFLLGRVNGGCLRLRHRGVAAVWWRMAWMIFGRKRRRINFLLIHARHSITCSGVCGSMRAFLTACETRR